MALNIKNEEAHRLARKLAEERGTSMTEAVTDALRRTLEVETAPGNADLLVREVASIQRLVADLPDRDPRTPDEILGYDEHGLPG